MKNYKTVWKIRAVNIFGCREREREYAKHNIQSLEILFQTDAAKHLIFAHIIHKTGKSHQFYIPRVIKDEKQITDLVKTTNFPYQKLEV